MLSRISAAALRKAKRASPEVPEPSDSEVIASDVRVAALESLVEVDERLLIIVQEIFDGTGLVENQTSVERLLFFRAEIIEHWTKSRASALAIGRALLDIERSLTASQFKRLKASTNRLFPFSDSVATMLRQNARMIEDERVSEVELPASYATAYQISRMDRTELAEARARGLINPQVQRPALVEFRREFKAATGPGSNVSHRSRDVQEMDKLKAELEYLKVKRRQKVAELFDIRSRIHELEAVLKRRR